MPVYISKEKIRTFEEWKINKEIVLSENKICTETHDICCKCGGTKHTEELDTSLWQEVIKIVNFKILKTRQGSQIHYTAERELNCVVVSKQENRTKYSGGNFGIKNASRTEFKFETEAY